VKVRPLAVHSPRAVRQVLLRYGWEDIRADAAAGSVEPVVMIVEATPESVIEALVRHNRQLGLDLLTGEGWVLLAGTRSRLAAFARPWVLPPELAEFAVAVGLALPAEAIANWQTARGPISLDRPVIAGILNVTPDSFSDGGAYASVENALRQADRMLTAGADLIDIGGESTRPGRPQPVEESEELERVIPILQSLVRMYPSLSVSVDTVKARVARRAMENGAAIINDVSGLRLDPAMAEVMAKTNAGAILMHSRGTVTDMATTDHADYGDDLVGVVQDELGRALEHALGAGVVPGAVVLDPGLGFSKTADQSLELLDQLACLTRLNRPLLVGPSRKRFLGAAIGRPVEDRDRATAIACVMAYERGARLFRVHDVALTREALTLALAVRGERSDTSW
jgi:dihydropteroate synthase